MPLVNPLPFTHLDWLFKLSAHHAWIIHCKWLHFFFDLFWLSIYAMVVRSCIYKLQIVFAYEWKRPRPLFAYSVWFTCKNAHGKRFTHSASWRTSEWASGCGEYKKCIAHFKFILSKSGKYQTNRLACQVCVSMAYLNSTQNTQKRWSWCDDESITLSTLVRFQSNCLLFTDFIIELLCVCVSKHTIRSQQRFC